MRLPNWNAADWAIFAGLVVVALSAIAFLIPFLNRKMLP